MIDSSRALRAANNKKAASPSSPSPWGSHDLTGLAPSARRSGRPAPVPLGERRRADAEALEGAQQAEAGVLGSGVRMDDPGQLVGEGQLPPHRPQAAGVPGVLSGDGKRREPTRGELGRGSHFVGQEPPTTPPPRRAGTSF